MGTAKKRGNGEGTIFKREINGKTMWVTEYTIAMYDGTTICLYTKTVNGIRALKCFNYIKRIL